MSHIINEISHNNDGNMFIHKFHGETFNKDTKITVLKNQQVIVIADGKEGLALEEGTYLLSELGIADSEQPVSAKVYFADKTVDMTADWETDSPVKYGSTLADFKGEITLRLSDPKKLAKVLADGGMLEDIFASLFVSKLNDSIKTSLESNEIAETAIEDHLDTISGSVKTFVLEEFLNVGVEISNLSVLSVKIKKSEHTKKPKNMRKLAGILIAAAAVCIAAFVVVAYVVVPAVKYSNAVKKIENKDYVAAAKILEDLGDYKDSKQKLSDIQIPLLRAKVANAKNGDYINLGKFEQDNNTANGEEEIQWVVLKVEDNKALLTTVQGLDAKPYNDVQSAITWKDCSLRAWLNGEFYEKAFNEEEKGIIVPTVNITSEDNSVEGIDRTYTTTDNVFLLSMDEISEVLNYEEDRVVVPTKYAISNGAYVNESDGNGWWWTRTLGNTSEYAVFVDSTGFTSYFGDGVSNAIMSTRPAIVIDLQV